MKLKSIVTQKKGIALNQAFGAILTLVLIAVLVIVGILLFVNLGSTFTDLATSPRTEENIGQVTETGKTTSNSTLCNFEDYAVSTATNNSIGGVIIGDGNYTVDSSAGTISFSEPTDEGGFNNTNWFINSTANWGGSTCVATQTTITQFGTYPVLIGLVGTIIFLGLVIGVLVSSFVFGRNEGAV